MIRIPVLIAGLALAAPAAHAQAVQYSYPAPTSPIASSVVVPPGYATIYLSGMVPDVAYPEAEKGSIAAYGTTEEQTESVLAKLRATLQAQGLDFKDVVSMHVFLVGDPAQGGKMDFGGMMKAYSRHFGTPDQPNRPVRATVQVAALAAPGFLVEIEVIAVKPAAAALVK
ncbi:MAG: RidA family protein [Asticcacaulis sp.]|uniref:RidA family protein n=1 Tax=Asticcacaulis sp. TaxID=1872648 RepID=UPI0039E4ECF0